MKNQLFSLMFTFIIVSAFAQDYSLVSKADFQQYVNNQENYYDSIIAANGSSDGIDGYTSFKRWKSFYQEKVHNDNGFANVLEGQYNFNTYFESIITNIQTIQGEWEELGPTHIPFDYNCSQYDETKGTGRVFFVEFDPNNSNRVFAGSPSGGLFISENHGASWTNAGTDHLPNPGISHFQMAPADNNNPEIWYILTGDGDNSWTFSYGVYRSRDKGITWKPINSGLNIPSPGNWKNYGRKLLMNPNNSDTMLVIYKTGIYKTSNARTVPATGVTWFNKRSGHFTDICYKPNSNYQIIYASTRDSIFISINAGNTWDPLPNLDQIDSLGPPQTNRITIRTTADNPNVLYAVTINSEPKSNSKIYKYDAITQNWSLMGGHLENDYSIGWGRYQAFAVSPTNENVLYKSRVHNTYKSTNGGVTWQSLGQQKHDDTHWICFENNDPQKMWQSTDGGLNYSSNGCTTLTNMTNNIGVAHPKRMSVGSNLPNSILFGGFDHGSLLFTKKTDDWGLMKRGDGYGTLINDTDVENPIYYMAVNSSQPVKTSDNGDNFTSLGIPTSIGVFGHNHCMVKDHSQQSTIYYAGKKRIGRSFDEGGSWEAISPDATADEGRYWEIFISKNHPNYLYASRIKLNDSTGIYRIFKTTNANASIASQVSWTEISPQINNDSVNQWCADIAINENNPDEIWACYGGYSNSKPKVIHYHNNQWTDITNDANNTLEYLSVGAIKRVPGNDNLIIIGTNAGVFFRSDEEPIWTKLSGIPHIHVNQIIIQEKVGKFLVASYGRGIWRANIPCITSGNDINITSNTTWNQNANIHGNVYVKSGYRLTIENCKLHFAPNKSIIVETGAELFVNGSVLDTRCNSLWGGIRVEGNSNLSQSPSSNQGAVKTYNNTEIKNAWTGVQAYRHKDEPSSGGGIVLAQNTKFINCGKGVDIWYYNQPNNSIISNCEFIVDNHLSASIEKPIGVDLYQNSSVAITDNDFRNINNHLIAQGRGIGVSINRGSTTINKRYTGNNFDGWYYGVSAKSFLGIDHVSVISNTFENCHTGIYMSGQNNAEVIFNDFSVIGDGVLANQLAGLYLDNCHDFIVEENNFHSNYDPSNPFPSIGLIVNNSEDNNNEIYKNTFNSIMYAALAQNSNRGANTEGLTFKCNEFSSNGEDISVTSTPFVSNPGIAPYQGSGGLSTEDPAGNLFSWTGPAGTPTDINNEEQQIVYYHHLPSSYHVVPTYTINTTANLVQIQYDQVLSCPSHQNTGGGIGDSKSLMASSTGEEELLQSDLASLKDGGDTPSLQSDVDNSVPPETMDLYNELINTSPYLSDTVVESSINKEQVLPNVLLRDIMVANPQSAKNDELIDAIDNRSSVMPDYMKAQILQGKTFIGAMEDLESSISYYKQKRAFAYRSCVSYYLNDTLTPIISMDSLLSLWENEPFLEARYQAAALYLISDQAQMANNLLNNLPNQFAMNPIQAEEYDQMLDYYGLLEQMQENNSIWSDLSEAELELLEDFETDGVGVAKVFARNIRLHLGLSDYDEPYLFPDMNKSTTAELDEQKIMESLNDFHYLKVFPNPAKDYLIIEYILESTQSNAILQLTDMSGKILSTNQLNNVQDQQILDTRNYKAGNYILSITVNNKTLESVNISIIK